MKNNFFFFLLLSCLNPCATIAAEDVEKEKNIYIDIYLPIFGCLDDFVQGKLFINKKDEYGKTFLEHGYQKLPKRYNVDNNNLSLSFCYGTKLIRGKDGQYTYVQLPVYSYKVNNLVFRFLFANTHLSGYKDSFSCYGDSNVDLIIKNHRFSGDINIFCWLGKPRKVSPVDSIENVGFEIVSDEDLYKVILAEPYSFFLNLKEKLSSKFDEGQGEGPFCFKDHIFSFVFLGEDPFDDEYDGVYAKEKREGLTLDIKGYPSLGDSLFFSYFCGQIKKVFDLEKVQNFLIAERFNNINKETLQKTVEDAFDALRKYSQKEVSKGCCADCLKNCCNC